MSCLVCHHPDVTPVLDLGVTTLANKFIMPQEAGHKEPAWPLRLGHCPECGHAQLLDAVPPAAMFEDYLYISSMSETLVTHLHGLAQTVTQRCKLSGDDLVVDIGCNDGTLLQGFRKQGARTLGVDPAQNLAPLAAQKGVEVLTGFFNEDTARAIGDTHGLARIVTMTNVFPHIQDLAGLFCGLDALLDARGMVVIEAHYLVDMLREVAFDTIYHEHVSYWSLHSACALAERCGFAVVDCERLPIHHGQLRLFIARAGTQEPGPAVAEYLAQEKALGLPGIAPLQQFAEQVEEMRRSWRDFTAMLKRDGKSLAGYGAPAKGNTLLSVLGAGPQDLAWIADKSPLKQGRLTPGTHIPIVPPEKVMAERPDYLLVLAWNFIDEIRAQLAEYEFHGGRFVLPVPQMTVVESGITAAA